MSEYRKIEDGKAEISVTVDGEKWNDARKKAFNKLARSLSLKGFRKGQVPPSLAAKHISDAEVNYEAANSITNETFDEVLKEHGVELIDKASLELKELDNDKVSMLFTCPIKPDVKLGDYSSVRYEVENVEVTDEEIEKEISRVLERKADLELKEDGEVENGDTAVIDFEGFRDGVPFEGGKAENCDLVIGSNSFIPGFEEQLIGMKPEEEKEIDVTFPENYHVEDLKGAATKFKVKVHEIKKKVLPELNDEFVKELKIDNVNTVEEYKNHLKEQNLSAKKKEAESAAEEALLDKFTETCEVNVPQVMIDDEVDRMFQDQAQRLMYQGISMEQYQKIIGQNNDEMKKVLEPMALRRVKTSLCLEALAAKEKIEAGYDDIAKHYEEMADMYKMDIEEIKKYVSEDSVREDLKLSKAIDFLKNNK
ncbi:MAG: trigger factor [Erysipelotrichaceae bacterium]|nr:trigger factor [Erysipelotrichaceae bacterium]